MFRYLVFLFLVLWVSATLPAKVIKKEAKALKQAFPQAKVFEAVALSPTAAQLAHLAQDLGRKPTSVPRLLRAVGDKGHTLGWAFIDNEPGKHLPMTYMVAINPGGEIIAMDLLIYRETQGHEVRSRRFRRQFKGKSLNDPIELTKDIDAISGATISSRTFTYGAKKSLWLIQKFLHIPKKKEKESESR